MNWKVGALVPVRFSRASNSFATSSMDFSILLDLQIIFETFKILLQKESTEGFDSKRAREMHDADCK